MITLIRSIGLGSGESGISGEKARDSAKSGFE